MSIFIGVTISHAYRTFLVVLPLSPPNFTSWNPVTDLFDSRTSRIHGYSMLLLRSIRRFSFILASRPCVRASPLRSHHVEGLGPGFICDIPIQFNFPFSSQ